MRRNVLFSFVGVVVAVGLMAVMQQGGKLELSERSVTKIRATKHGFPITDFTPHVNQLLEKMDFNVECGGGRINLTVSRPFSTPSAIDCADNSQVNKWWCKILKRVFWEKNRTLPGNVSIYFSSADRMYPEHGPFKCIESSSIGGEFCMTNFLEVSRMDSRIEYPNIPWENRSSIPVWRGKPFMSGGNNAVEDVSRAYQDALSRAPRLQVVEYSYDHPNLLDAKVWTLKKLIEHKYWKEREINGLGRLYPGDSFIPQESYYVKYQVALVLGGIGAAFRTSIHLSTETAVVLQEFKYKEWFTPMMVPFKHYIPLREDFADLDQKMRWVADHPLEVRQIARNGYQFYQRYLSFEKNEEHIAELVYRMAMLKIEQESTDDDLSESTSDDSKDIITGEMKDISPSSQANTTHEHCAIHIHGFHHSGTGFTRQIVYDSLGGNRTASQHTNSGKPQDEGLFIQTVYPNYRQRLRDPSLCGLPRNQLPTVETLHNLYYCPPLVDSIGGANVTNTRQELHSQWAQYWDMTKPYLVQKSPTMDVVLLERLKQYPTVHVIVMRQPFGFKRADLFPESTSKYHSLHQDALYLPLTWWKVWTYVLEQLALGQVESFVVVQYETMAQQREATSKELAEYIHGKCNVDHEDANNRRLHLHETGGDASKYLVSSYAIKEYSACRKKDARCLDFMNETASVLQEFGYQWNPQKATRPSESNPLLLYTSDKPPTMELVERMKAVLTKVK